MVGGLSRNCISLLNSGVVPLQRCLEHLPVDDTAETTAACEEAFAYMHPNSLCCRNKSDDSFVDCVQSEQHDAEEQDAEGGTSILDPETLMVTQDALTVSRPSVTQTERTHARNQQRSKPRLQNVRGLRRQVSTYIALAAKLRYASISKHHEVHSSR